MAFTSPVQMIICLIILCVNLGYSAVPGFAFFVLLSPVQGKITKKLFMLRCVFLLPMSAKSDLGKQETKHGVD